jgi:hypothetical protein
MQETQESAPFVKQKLIPMTPLTTVIKASARTVLGGIKLTCTVSAKKAVDVTDDAIYCSINWLEFTSQQTTKKPAIARAERSSKQSSITIRSSRC